MLRALAFLSFLALAALAPRPLIEDALRSGAVVTSHAVTPGAPSQLVVEAAEVDADDDRDDDSRALEVSATSIAPRSPRTLRLAALAPKCSRSIKRSFATQECGPPRA